MKTKWTTNKSLEKNKHLSSRTSILKMQIVASLLVAH